MVTPPQVLNKKRKGMRLLLISDTHGKLDIINELLAQTQADAVIPAGDLGFYDEDSFERLSDRELRLHVIHSDLPRAEKDNLLTILKTYIGL
jgi:Icc-related predicted phosphoesterase